MGEFIKLGSLVDIRTGKLNANAANENGCYPFFTCSVESLTINTYAYDCESVLIAGNGDLNVKYYNGKFNAYQRTYIIESKDKDILSVRFLYYFLCEYIDTLRNNSIGGVIKYIKLSDLTDINFPLIPIKEQQRVVNILDKAEEIRTKKKLANEKLDEFLKSTFIDMFGDPVTNPKGFIVSKLSNLTTLVSSGSTPLGGASTYLTQGILFIRSQNVLMNKFKFDDVAYISEETHNKMSRTKVNKYDVLLNITGASIGRVNYFEGEDGSANVNQHVCIIRPVLEKIMPQYLTFFIGNDFFQRKIIRENSGATRQALNFQQIKNFEIPVPSIILQNQFAQIVQKVEAQKEKNQKVIEQMDNLFNSLMQQAFNGEM